LQNYLQYFSCIISTIRKISKKMINLNRYLQNKIKKLQNIMDIDKNLK
jgi:hypothetical protein